MLRKLPIKPCTCSFITSTSSFSTSSILADTTLSLAQRLEARRLALPSTLSTPSTPSITSAPPPPPDFVLPSSYAPFVRLVKKRQETLSSKAVVTPLGNLVNTALQALTKKDRKAIYSNSDDWHGSNRRENRNYKSAIDLSKERRMRAMGTSISKRDQDLRDFKLHQVAAAVSEASTPIFKRLPGQSKRGSITRQKIKRNHVAGTSLASGVELTNDEKLGLNFRAITGRIAPNVLMLPWDELPLRTRITMSGNAGRVMKKIEKEKAETKAKRDLIESNKLIEMADVLGFDNALDAASKSKFLWQVSQDREAALAEQRKKNEAELKATELAPLPESTPSSSIFASLLTDLIEELPSSPSGPSISAPNAKELPLLGAVVKKSQPVPVVTLSYPVGVYNYKNKNQDKIDFARRHYESRMIGHNQRARSLLEVEQRIKAEANAAALLPASYPTGTAASGLSLPPTGPIASKSKFLKRVGLIEQQTLEIKKKKEEEEAFARRVEEEEPKKIKAPLAAASKKVAEQENGARKFNTSVNSYPAPPSRSVYSNFLSPSSVTPTRIFPPFDPVPIATLAHGLDRVLFNPGVHFVQSPTSPSVYNFSPDLQKIPSLSEFDFDKLPRYITSSQDDTLNEMALKEGKEFVGSTSSTVGLLCQIYFWLSKGKGPNYRMLSSRWLSEKSQFGYGQTIPASIILNEKDGKYSIDVDKSYEPETENVLSSYGHLMEKFLTTDTKEFKRFLVNSDDPAPSQADVRQAYHYVKTDHMILRSQLDAYNEHLPNGSFDVKTRGTAAIRQDRLNHVAGSEYHLTKLQGEHESFEKEYFDLIRSAFLKYQFQARIGRMDGCIVAYHNTLQFFGFQYVSIPEMDIALFGSTAEGDAVYPMCLAFLEKILLEAKAAYPGVSSNVTLAGAQMGESILRVFVEPREDTNGRMTLLEIQGTSYLDQMPCGQLDFKKFESSGRDIPSWEVGYRITRHSTEESNSDASSTESPVAKDGLPARKPLKAKEIKHLFDEVRREQLSFNTLVLPSDVTVADLKSAIARTSSSPSTPSTNEGNETINEFETISSDSSSSLEASPQISSSSEPTSEELAAATAYDTDMNLASRFPNVLGLKYTSNPSANIKNLRLIGEQSKAARAKLPSREGMKKYIVRNQMEVLED